MIVRRALKVSAAVLLSFGLLTLAVNDNLLAGSNPKDAEKYTTQLKTAKKAELKVEALTELGKLGQIQKALVLPAMDAIMSALDDKDASVRAAAAKTLGMVDPDPKAAIPALLKLLKDDKEETVKIAAATGLGYMGSNAKEASGPLREVVKNEDKKSKLGKAAGNALKSINPKK